MKTKILKVVIFALGLSVPFSTVQAQWHLNEEVGPNGYVYTDYKWLGISNNDFGTTSGIYFSRGIWANIKRSLSFIPESNRFYFSHDLEIQGSGGLILKNDTNITGIDKLNGYNDIRFSTNNGTSVNMTLTNDGKLGINTPSPESGLHVKDLNGITVENNGIKIRIHANSNNTKGWIGTASNHGLFLGTNNTGTNMYLDTIGNVFVGDKKSVSTGKLAYYDLFVNGGVLTEDVGLADVNHWPDYVFEENYTLKSIEEVETFIQKEGHLPNIPSADEVKESGYTVKDMNVRFLEKIEELILYTIQQQKELETLKTEIRLLNDKLEKQE